MPRTRRDPRDPAALNRRAALRVVPSALWIACAALIAAPAAAQSPSFDVVLSRMFDYSDRFLRDFGGMVAEEQYTQTTRQPAGRADSRRDLKSDFLLVNVPGLGWTPFRDVFEADGRAVRDRQDRLTKLFLSGATPGAVEQARRIMDEGARYNLGNGTRNINVPTLALMYLAPDTRGGVRFEDGGADKDRPKERRIAFTEVQRPTLIGTTGGRNLPVSGIVWVNEDSGAITRTELHATDVDVNAEVVVFFEPNGDIYLPRRMEDVFKPRQGTEVRGVATYSRFRRFQVNTTEDVAKPDADGSPSAPQGKP